jgi:hypothetical protein
MHECNIRITGRIAWLWGKDSAGVVRYAPVDELTISPFAMTVLGNFYAHVETIVGFGFRQSLNEPWSVFDTLPEAREHARMMRGILTDTRQSPSA